MKNIIEYIWLDGYGNLRSKTRILESYYEISKAASCPNWNYDGSSTNQADGSDSEIILKPKAIFNDPFRGEHSKLLLCDTYLPNMDPHSTNTRAKAVETFNKAKGLKPKFGIEQEFFISKNGKPIGFVDEVGNTINPKAQGNYYCGIGGDNAIERELVEEAFQNCLQAGLSVTGMNSEVAPSQWEIQICDYGIDVCDQLYIMRYILDRTFEKKGYCINIDPKPIKGDWNGSGCHVNFSTEPMRQSKGYDVIKDAITRLSKKHDYHMERYGEGNNERMTGEHETAAYDKFSFGVANRGASVRIPRSTLDENKGYFEDRRPASNMDPYIVCALLFETCCL
tara:strand:+ start:2029 stop:3042 length:1014 start_codon:yes stop_codon:yes gene_type:complete